MKRRLWLAAVALAVLGAIGASRAWWLPLPALWLRVDEPVRTADLIVVLSGESLWRIRGAAEFFHERYAPRVVVTGENQYDDYFEMATGERVSDAELAARVLVRLGVPRNALVLVNGVTSTHDEAVALRKYVEAHRTRSIILVTSHLHSRRARWTFRRVFANLPTELMTVEAEQPDVSPSDWWRHPDAALGVLNEYLKFGYYVVRY